MKSESYEAAAFLLRHSSMAHLIDDSVVNDATERIDAEALDAVTLSHGEKVIVDAAWDLYNGCGEAGLADCITHLDDANFAAFVEALRLRRPSAFTSNLIGAKARRSDGRSLSSLDTVPQFLNGGGT